jgi:hypothetical protein
MSDSLDWVRTLGINGGVFAAVSLADIEVGLRIILLTATIVWTIVKIYKLLKTDGDNTKN